MYYRELREIRSELVAEGADFELVTIDVGGAPIRSFKHASPDLRAVWLSTEQFGAREYILYNEERLTYEAAHRNVASIVNWLMAQGVVPGDRVGIAMRNYPEWMLIYWACAAMGVASVAMNAWWTAEEMAYAFGDSAPKVVFCDGERLDRIGQKPEMVGEILLVGVRSEPSPGVRPWTEVVATGGALPDVAIDPDSDACIMYTSGTTGFAKGAQLTHRSCTAQLMNLRYSSLAQAMAIQRATNAPPKEPQPPVSLLATPLFHVTANNCAAQIVTAAGGKLVLMYRWHAGEALELIERERVNFMSAVPTMARELISHPDYARRDTSSLGTLGGGGAQVQPDLVAKIETGPKTTRPSTGYGMTEASGIIASITADFFIDRPESVGPALPGLEVKCVDEHGQTVPRGEVGELWLRGASIFKGYLNKPEATAETLTDGWLHTGDIARLDEDDFIYLVDRKKEMVLRGGENVYCSEVEVAVYRHPAVAECSVFGVPDPRLGEEVGAAIVLKPGYAVEARDVRDHCAALIAKYKVPRYIWILPTALPRNATGKFLKRELRETLSVESAG